MNEKTVENLLNLLDECGPNAQISFGSDPKNIELQREFEEFCDEVLRKKRVINEWDFISPELRQGYEIPLFTSVEMRLLTRLEQNPNISKRTATKGTECRFCLTSPNNLLGLSELDPEIQNVAREFFHVTVFDGFPGDICPECHDILKNIVRFRRKVKESHTTLLNLAFEKIFKQQLKDETDDLLLLSNVSEALAQDSDGQDSGESATQKLQENPKPDTKRHICDYCDKSFRTKLSLKVHLRTHTNQRPYSCSECQKTFKTYSAVSNHRASHDTEKRVECPVQDCSYRTTTNANLKIHSRTHTKERKYSCKQCQFKFTTASNLSKHVKNIHYNIKEHACSHCDKMFFTKESARKHEVSHSNLKPYSCPVCPLNYAWYNGLQKHMKSVHPGIKSATEKMYFDKIVSKVQ